jgi:hypothetical protein
MNDGVKDGLNGRALPTCLRFMGWVGICSLTLSFSSPYLLYYFSLTLQHSKRPLQEYPDYHHRNDERSDYATTIDLHHAYV